MMKMGYMSKNFYEMRYTVSQATADGSNTATDLTPNISFFIETSPEEAFEHIKVKFSVFRPNLILNDKKTQLLYTKPPICLWC